MWLGFSGISDDGVPTHLQSLMSSGTPSFTAAIPKGGVTGFVDVSSSADALMSAINQQPVSVAIEADQSAFQSYSGGILSEGCGTNLDHGVLAVGYDIAEGYYLVKNSWGSKSGS